MWRNFRKKLVITLGLFAIIIAIPIAIIDHFRITDQAIRDNEFQVEKIESTVTYSLHTIDKAYHYFEEDLTEKMRTNTLVLLQEYKENPTFESWNLDEVKEEFDMNIFIIDSDNVIVASSEESDIGMDFNTCCGKLAKILDERREAGGFFHDGMDIAQATGEVTKFSYMATPDKEYIIELGYSLEDGEIFQDFNFFSVMDDLKENYPSIDDIAILNIGGLALGSEAEESNLSEEQREAFEQTLQQEETHEVRTEIDDETVIYRYVPYDSKYDGGSTQNKVIEITYNERELEEVLVNHRQAFLIQLAFILLLTTIIAFIISKWVARPMHMAFHDRLTGLRNRAAFEDDLSQALQDKDSLTSLLMIDLDHFKLVNDWYGHREGDRLLKQMAETIQSVLSSGEKAYRLGGDEFAIVLKNTTEVEAEKTAEQVLKKLNENVLNEGSYHEITITASIGIAFSSETTVEVEDLYNEADIALYESKLNGKNQYRLNNQLS